MREKKHAPQPWEAPQDARAKPSLWLWVPFVWLFFVSTRALSTWMSGHAEGAGAADFTGSPVDLALMGFLMVVGTIGLCLRQKKTRRILANNKWVVVLFVYMALSYYWSNFPDITLRRAVRSIGTLIMVLVVLTERSPLEAIRALLRRLYVIEIPASMIAIKYYRNIGVLYGWDGTEEQWIGLSTDKNSLGQVAMVSGLFWVWQMFGDWSNKLAKWRWIRLGFDAVFLLMTLWLLRGSPTSHSSTAILAFVACSAVLFGLEMVIRRITGQKRRIVLAAMIASTLLAPFVALALQSIDASPAKMVVQATGRDMTFTDRTRLWTDVLNNAEKSPIVGTGFGAFWVGKIGYDMYPLPNWSEKTPEWRPEQGHNGYVDTFVETGLIGVVLLAIIIVMGFVSALRGLDKNFELASLRVVLLLSIVMNNMTETSFLKGTHALWFLFLLVAMDVPPVKLKARPKGYEQLPKAVPEPEVEADTYVQTRSGLRQSQCAEPL